MIPTLCPLCGYPSVHTISQAHTDSATTIRYDLYECSDCLGQFWWPLKNPGGLWYGHDERYADRNRLPILTPNWNHTTIISHLAPRVGSVLDVGCGVGTFLAWAKEHGWQTVGLDFDQDAIEAGKRTFGLDELYVSDLASYATTHHGKRFDLVTFFDVLEHIDNHREFMATIRDVLTSEGYIAISMPYRGRADWLMPADVPPRHLTRWNREALTRFLNQEDFDVVYTHRTAASIPFIIQKLRFRFGRGISIGLVGKVRAKEGPRSRQSLLVQFATLVAKVKDTIIFGLPALIIWLLLLPSDRRYIGLYAIARKRY